MWQCEPTCVVYNVHFLKCRLEAQDKTLISASRLLLHFAWQPGDWSTKCRTQRPKVKTLRFRVKLGEMATLVVAESLPVDAIPGPIKLAFTAGFCLRCHLMQDSLPDSLADWLPQWSLLGHWSSSDISVQKETHPSYLSTSVVSVSL